MQKIPTIFIRDWDGNPKYVTREPNPECAWVFAGEGTATRKYDGTCVMLDDDGEWWARREVKPGKTPPPGFVALATDPETGKTMGWEPIAQSAFARWHAEALDARLTPQGRYHVGTYELVGPKVNGNPERREHHELIAHADAEKINPLNRTYDGLSASLEYMAEQYGCEGIVFHHSDGRMAKIKDRDFPPTGTGR